MQKVLVSPLLLAILSNVDFAVENDDLRPDDDKGSIDDYDVVFPIVIEPIPQHPGEGTWLSSNENYYFEK